MAQLATLFDPTIALASELTVKLNRVTSTDEVKLKYNSDTTIGDLKRLLRESPYNFDATAVALVDVGEGTSGPSEELGDARSVQDLVARNGLIAFEGKDLVAVADNVLDDSDVPDASAGPLDAVNRNEVGQSKLRGSSKLHVGDKYFGDGSKIPESLKKGVANVIRRHDGADQSEGQVGNFAGLSQ